ncbi:hypothetical protein BELL_0090g00180 [Botrytis elliptica]|uniref:Uncharacterized protein n=1 Tax=Botrytis elliptica TaxID=278938 RepID=A0A4Z1JWM5_9HELO|nr:hypothetical protein EAE99_004125 [Botrytis elliptica]TGO77816.1 hypothetical protein BELL_0090g00180 [Botrytis elliptica]
MSSPNFHPGLDSQDLLDLPSTPILHPSTPFDEEEQHRVSESAGLASMDATMDRNPVDENLDDESEDEQRGRTRTPRTVASSSASTITNIPPTRLYTPDSTSASTQSLEPLHLNPNLEPNLTLAHITSLPQSTILNYISAYRLARQRSFEEHFHPLHANSQTVAPESQRDTLNNADVDSDFSSSSTSTTRSMPAPAPGPQRRRYRYQDSIGQFTSPHWRHQILAPLNPSPTTGQPGSGLPSPSPYGNRINGDDRLITLTGGQDNMARERVEQETSLRSLRIAPSSVVEPENRGSTGIDSDSDLQAQIRFQSQRLREASPDSRAGIRDILTILVMGGQDNMARERVEQETSLRSLRNAPSSVIEPENRGSTDIDSDSDLQAQIRFQSQRLREASPDSRAGIRDILTILVTQTWANQAREPVRGVITDDRVEAANSSISQAANSQARDLNSGNAISRPPVVAFNQDGTISFPQRRTLLNPVNNSDSSVQEEINADAAARRARSGLPALPSLEPANAYYTADSPAPNRSEINRILFRMEISVQNVRQIYLFEIQERREMASLSPVVPSVIETQNVRPSVQDLLIDLESQVGRVRDQIMGTDLTRPEIPSNGGVNAEVEDTGVDIDLDMDLMRPLSRQSSIENYGDAEPSMAEQLAAYQISRNHPNPESTIVNRDIPRDISPHDNSELSDLSQILAAYQDDMPNITTRDQLARRRAELRLIETRIRAGLPIESRDISPSILENVNTLTRAPRLRPSTSYENLRLERQLAALSTGAARDTIPAHRSNPLPRAQRERDAANAQRIEMLQKPAISVFDHLVKWQLYLENSATRIDSQIPEEWSSRLGNYTLIPASTSARSIEDVSGSPRSDEEILAAYSANTSYGFREILRLVREDGLDAREAWHYVLLWKDYLSESPIDEYHEALGLCPMDIFMHVIIQGLSRGFGDWKMSVRCNVECVKYLVTRTSYYPFPSAETIDAASTFGDVTSQTLREYFGSEISFLDEEWDMLAALKNNRYSTARILHLAKNIARGIAKLDTIDLKPPYDESNNAQRKDIFHRLKLEEIALAGQHGLLSAREHQALSIDGSSVERVLVEYMLKWDLVPEEREQMFQAFDGGASVESLTRSRQR